METKIYEQYIKNFDVNLLDCTFLAKGHNGAVYLLPDGKVIKICFKAKNCRKEFSILDKINSNKYFPRVYGMSGNYIIRDYIDGTILNDYIRQYGLNKELALKIMDLLIEFRKLKFSKEDVRCKDIIIQPSGLLMVIDPKKFYSRKRAFPKHLEKGLCRLGVLDFFMSIAKKERPKLYLQWKKKGDEYIRQIEN